MRSLRGRILLTALVPLAMTGAALVSAHYAIKAVSAGAERLARSQEVMSSLEAIYSEVRTIQHNLLFYAGYQAGPALNTADYSRARVEKSVNKFRGAATPDMSRRFDTIEPLVLSALDTLMTAQARRSSEHALIDAAGRSARAEALQFELVADVRARVLVNHREYLASQQRLESIGIAIAVVGVLVLLGAGIEAARLIRWIGWAAAAAGEFANGRFDARVAVEGPAEIQALGRAINAAGGAIAERDGRLRTAVSEAGRQRDLLSAVIESTSDGLLLYGSGGDIILANSRCAELLGLDYRDFSNKSAALMQEDVRPRSERPDAYAQSLAAHFTHAAAPWQDRLVLVEPSRRVIRRASVPLLREREIVGRVFTYTDITTEADLDRIKSEFVSIASHELRTPLTSIHGSLQLAVAGSGDRILPEDRELMEICLDSTGRLVRLVNDLLDLSKIEAGKMPMRLSPLAPRVLLEQAADTMGGLAAQSGIRILPDAADVDVFVDGDADLVNRVLVNLVSNALKYSPAATTVTLGTQLTAAGVQFSVDDEGPGIDPAQALLLFQPFSRVGAQEFDRTSGTGLGLAIARAIVEQHSGRIWAEPRAAGGTRFAFTLSVSQGALQLTA